MALDAADLLPPLPGLTYGLTRAPVWASKVQRIASGRSLEASYSSYPVWRYTLPYAFLRQAASSGQAFAKNLVLKANFEDGSKGGWDGASSVVAVSGQSFTRALRVVSRQTFEMAPEAPVAPGQVFRVQAVCRNNSGVYSSSLGLGFIGVNGSLTDYRSGIVQAANAAFSARSGQLVVPFGAVAAVPEIRIDMPVGTTGQSADYSQLLITTRAFDLDALEGFYNRFAGMGRRFYYFDADQNPVPRNVFGTGNGSTKVFRLSRPVAQWREPIQGLYDAPMIWSAGVLRTPGTDYTLLDDGFVVFPNAPANGALLEWSGNFLHRCRFEQDELSFKKDYSNFWSQGGLRFVTVKP